jgi:hypothetical protein
MTDSVFTLEDQRKQLLRDFVLSVIREVGVRCHGFAPKTPEEQRFQREGATRPSDLDAVKALSRI